MEFKFEVDVSQAVKALDDLIKNIPQAMTKTLDDTARDIVSDARSDAPFDTGRLRDSIRIMRRDRNSVTVGSDVEYAGFVEFGTYKMEAQPFLTPNVEVAADNFPARFIENLKG